MAGTTPQFSVALAQFAAKVGKRADEVVKSITHEITARVVERSPVDTGTFRANWQLGLDAPVTGTVSVGSAAADIDPAQRYAGHVIYLTNNVEYGMRLEYGFTGTDSLGRTYDQPPRGFVALTVLEFQQIANDAVAQGGALGDLY